MPVVPVAGAEARHPDKRDHPATGGTPVGLAAGETPATPTSATIPQRARRGACLACGSERGAVAHELRKVCVYDAVALLDGIVAREDVLWIVVANLLERRVFSVFGFAVVHHGHARLHVGVSGIALAENEIAFKRTYSPDACRIAVGTGVGVDHILKRGP